MQWEHYKTLFFLKTLSIFNLVKVRVWHSFHQKSQLSIHWKLQWTLQGNLAFSFHSYFISRTLTLNKTSYCPFFKVMTTNTSQPKYFWLELFWDNSSKEVQMKRVHNATYSMKQNIQGCISLLFEWNLSGKYFNDCICFPTSLRTLK